MRQERPQLKFNNTLGVKRRLVKRREKKKQNQGRRRDQKMKEKWRRLQPRGGIDSGLEDERDGEDSWSQCTAVPIAREPKEQEKHSV